MKTISTYQEEIKNMIAEADRMQEIASSENREFTEAELSARKNLYEVIAAHERRIADLKERENIDSRLSKPDKALTVDTGSKIVVGDDRATKDKFRTPGEFFMAVARAAKPNGGVDPRLYNAAGLNETTASEGGFLVQTDFSNRLAADLMATDILAARCDRIQVSGAANSMKINGYDETDRSSTRFGGVVSYFKAEAAEKTKSKPAFRQIELNLHKIIGLCYATDELLQDATALEGFIRQAFVSEFGFRRDDSIINGTGAGQPLGIINAGCLIQVTKETGQKADTIVAENIFKMYARMFPQSLGNAIWLINQSCWPQLFSMSLAVGTGGSALFVPAGGISASPYATLMGRPIIPIEQCPALGDLGDIIFADMSGYLLAEKGGIQSDMSIHVNFIYDESVFRFVLRIDGQPWRAKALTPYKGGSGATLSHFVALAERA